MNRMLVLVVSASAIAALSVPGPVRADHPDATVTIGAETNTYTPNDLTVEAGTTVHWVKAPGSRSHNVQADDDSFSSGVPTTGAIDFTYRFDAPGEFPYHCSVHGFSMSGTVRVTGGSPSALSIDDVTRSEGHSRTKSFTFAVTMAAQQPDDVTIDYATADGSATAGSDYVAKNGTLTIASGSLSANITVEVNGDVDVEPDETFTVTLTDPSSNATIADGTGTATITNDDPPSGDEPPAPIADAGGPYQVDEGGSVTLDGTGSTDPEDGGSIEAYAWDVDGDGNVDATGATVVVPFLQEGGLTVTLTVTDDDDQDASDDATVTVTDGANLSRAAGDDRILTAVASARRGWSATEHALLATGFAFPDALAATALAAKLDAPLLLTRPAALPAEALDALRDLGVDTVWILGGTVAVSQDVQDELVANGFTVRRLQGANRFETARVVALEVGASATDEVVVALGQHADVTRDSWPDALSAGSLSAGPDRLPTLLTRSVSLPSVTERTLSDLGARKVWLLGGSAAISGDVEARLNALGYQVERLEGQSRYGTSVAVAAEAMDRLPDGDVPLVFATGGNFPDGLTAGAYAARIGGLVVLVHPTDLAGGASAVAEFVATNASRFDVATVIGGTAAVAAEVARELVEAMTA